MGLASSGISEIPPNQSIPLDLFLLDTVEAVDEELVDEEASLLPPPHSYIQNKCRQLKYSLLDHCHQDKTPQNFVLKRKIELKEEKVFS